MYEPMSLVEFQAAMPDHVRKNVNQQLVDQVNQVISDPEVAAVFRENVLGFSTVMKEGKFKLYDYLHAVKYASHVLLGDKQVQAWAKTFPARYKDMMTRGTSSSDVAAVASRYNGSKLVQLIMAQSMIPTHILNAPLHQKMINHLANLAMTAKSEKVQCDAASKLVDALKPPEVKKVELDISAKEDSSIQELRASTLALARQQREMIEQGQLTPKAAAEARLIGESSTDD